MPRRLKSSFANFLVIWGSAIPAHADLLDLAVMREGQAPLHYRLDSAAAGTTTRPLESKRVTPLGSLWKLFVYFYLVENDMHPPRYVCKGEDKEELFCCKPKGDIDLDEALAKSCGLYFAPKRLGITDEAWKKLWHERGVPWLTTLSSLAPATRVPVPELLQALKQIRDRTASWRRLDGALSRVVIDGTARGTVRKLGSRLHVKTFTWDGETKGKYSGGFAGWASDGSPVWGQGAGTGAQVLSKWGTRIDEVLKTGTKQASGDCVTVSYFDRYPVANVLALPSLTPAPLGPLTGRFRVEFANGNALDISSGGELRLGREAKRGARIAGTFPVNEYVGRVIDREISARPIEAARAFGILIRTYLYQNANRKDGCYSISDSTRKQRVSPNPSSEGARQIAAWSDRLIIEGVPNVRYHSDRGANGVLAWTRAVELANQGSYFDEILRGAYPAMQLGLSEARGNASCQRIAQAEAWVRRQEKLWHRALAHEAGFQPPGSFRICRSSGAQPYSDPERNIIYLRYSGDLEDQQTALHEYLHLAFKYHHVGSNESFIEAKAREIVALPERGRDL